MYIYIYMHIRYTLVKYPVCPAKILIFTHSEYEPWTLNVAVAGWGFISPDNTEDINPGSRKMAEHIDANKQQKIGYTT